MDMKIALIGIGDIAKKAYLPFITTTFSNVNWVLCSRDSTGLAQVAAQYRIKETYTDYKQLLTAGVDAVMIHSATSSHPSIAAFFLKARVPTYVDKPLADNAHDCEALYELAEQHRQPLYLGFNRRHIPFYNQHLVDVQKGKPQQSLRSLCWEKHRFNQVGDVRTFIFDDFIHPLDSINIFAKTDVQDLHIISQFQGDKLARVDVEWQQNGTLLQASMNRMFGRTQERVSANFDNQSYQFDNFISGILWQEDKTELLQEKDWQPMLATKGFESMIHEWINVVKTGVLPDNQMARNLSSHQLAEAVCHKVVSGLK